MFRQLFLVPLLLLCTAAAASNRLETLVGNLASADPEVRSAARIELMNLSARDLPQLADAADALPGLNHNQREALRVVVDHVCIKEQVHRMMGMGGFLGVNFALDANEAGVRVRECHIGLPAFQHLRPGDVITGVRTDQWHVIRNGTDLQAAVMGGEAGDTVTLQVRRGIEIKTINLELAPNFTAILPMAAQGRALIDVQNRGFADADRIWEARFAPLFDVEAVARVE